MVFEWYFNGTLVVYVNTQLARSNGIEWYFVYTIERTAKIMLYH